MALCQNFLNSSGNVLVSNFWDGIKRENLKKGGFIDSDRMLLNFMILIIRVAAYRPNLWHSLHLEVFGKARYPCLGLYSKIFCILCRSIQKLKKINEKYLKKLKGITGYA